jgi:hypothetical protein
MTRLDSAAFEEPVDRDPVLSWGALASPLVRSSTSARTRFLKAACCRLIAKLYIVKPGGGCSGGGNDRDRAAIELSGSLPSVTHAFMTLLGKKEMHKAKRLREVIKGLTTVLDFASATASSQAPF